MTAGSTAAFDTSVAVPLLVASHPEHTRVLAWAKGRTLSLSGHPFMEPLLLSTRGVRDAHRELASRGVVGGAAYDGLVALAAREHGVVLVTRDARTRSTYEALDVTVELLATGEVGQ